MKFLYLPSDALRSIISLLDLDDIVTLRICSIEIARRMVVEHLVTSILIDSPHFPLPRISHVSSHLRELTVHLEVQAAAIRHIGIEWVLLLPKTLVKIDFGFYTSCMIWLRPSSPLDKIPLIEKSSCQRYAPIFIDELFPALQHLRLSGEWGHPWVVLPNRHAPDDLFYWTPYMVSLWVKHLPRNMLSLEFPLCSQEELIIPFLPPNLTSLHRFTSQALENRNNAPKLGPLFDEELFESINSLWWPFSTEELPNLLPKFRALETLDFTNLPMHPSCFSLLPRTLKKFCFQFISHTSPRLRMNSQDAVLEHFHLLPSELISLELRCLSLPPEDPNEKGVSNMADLLPRQLTSLSFTRIGQNFCASDRLTGLQRTHTHLQKLEITSEYYLITLQNLDFLPSSLQTLVLATDSRARHPTRPSSSLPWPKDNQLKTLVVYGSLVYIFYMNALPVGLTYLEVQNVTNPVRLLRGCPTSLRTLIIRNSYNSGTDNFQRTQGVPTRYPLDTVELLTLTGNLDMPKAIDSSLPPLPNLTRFVGPVEYPYAPIETDATELSVKMMKKKIRGLANGLLRHSLTNFERPFSSALPTTITSVDLPVVVAEVSPIWELRSLTSLKVYSVFANWPNDSVIPAIPSLTRIHHSRPCVTLPQCLQSLAFQSVRDLKIILSGSVLQDFSAVARLSSLTHISIDANNFGYSTHYCKILAHLPITVTSLETRMLPDWFWNAYTSSPSAIMTSISNSVEYMMSKASSFLRYMRSLPPTEAITGPKLNLQRLDLNSSGDLILFDSQLAWLAPHLTELGVGLVAVTDRVKLIGGLCRDLKKIDDLNLIQAICPSVQVFHPGNSLNPNKRLVLIDKDATHRSSVQLACAKALPQSLTELGSVMPYHPFVNLHLPPNLTSLESEIPLQYPHFSTLPASVVKLKFRLQARNTFSPQQCATLPNRLIELTIEDLAVLSKQAAAVLPATLCTFNAPQLVLGNSIYCLPGALTSLSICSIKPKLLSSATWIPSSLVALTCRLPQIPLPSTSSSD